MKKKDLENLHAKTIDELKALLPSLGEGISRAQMDQRSGGKIKNINDARNKMKDRARILTIITEKMKGEKAVAAKK